MARPGPGLTSMEQLSGLDAAFVHQDSRRTPMHITAVLVYDIGDESAGAIDTARLGSLVARRLRQFPVFHRRLLRVPMDVDTPYWVDAPQPDPDYHISRRSLPAGGGWAELQRLLASIHGRRMDLAKPLWEMCLLDGLHGLRGLPGHCQALVIKIHHSAIDGISLARIIDALHGDTPPRVRHKPEVKPAPSYWEMWNRSYLNNIGRQFRLTNTLGNLLPGVLRARRSGRKFDDLPPLSTRRAHFNDNVGSGRSMGVALWPLAQLLAIKRSVRHVTLNDIALAIVSGALREYLLRHRRLPSRSLIAGVPVNLRGDPEGEAGGNRIATMAVGLASLEDDPVARLRLVHRYAVAGKSRIDALGSGTVMDISDSLSPNILAGGIRALAQAGRLAVTPVPFHTMVSNVPGPRGDLYLDAARLVVPLGFGPIRDNMGLFHIVSNSRGFLSLSFNACDRLMPDAAVYQRCLENAFSRLYDRACAG